MVLGRTHIKDVASKRKVELNSYVHSLMRSSAEVSQVGRKFNMYINIYLLLANHKRRNLIFYKLQRLFSWLLCIVHCVDIFSLVWSYLHLLPSYCKRWQARGGWRTPKNSRHVIRFTAVIVKLYAVIDSAHISIVKLFYLNACRYGWPTVSSVHLIF